MTTTSASFTGTPWKLTESSTVDWLPGSTTGRPEAASTGAWTASVTFRELSCGGVKWKGSEPVGERKGGPPSFRCNS